MAITDALDGSRHESDSCHFSVYLKQFSVGCDLTRSLFAKCIDPREKAQNRGQASPYDLSASALHICPFSFGLFGCPSYFKVCVSGSIYSVDHTKLNCIADTRLLSRWLARRTKCQKLLAQPEHVQRYNLTQLTAVCQSVPYSMRALLIHNKHNLYTVTHLHSLSSKCPMR